jgi:solute:Na+ symporter, SSS family
VYARQDNISLSMLGWVTGCSVIWSGLFLVGNILYGRWGYAIILGAVLAVTGSMLIWTIRRLWR